MGWGIDPAYGAAQDEELIDKFFDKAFSIQYVEDGVVMWDAHDDVDWGDDPWEEEEKLVEVYLADNNQWFIREEEEMGALDINVGDIVVLRKIIKPFGLFNHFNPGIVVDKFKDPKDGAIVFKVDLIYYKGMVASDGRGIGPAQQPSLTGYEFEEEEKDLHKVPIVEVANRKKIGDTFADRVGFSKYCREAVSEYLLNEKLQGKLTAEVFNTREYDGEKAMDITKKMLGG
jgi:hypothetical protein